MKKFRLVLASTSPRRAQLLRDAGYAFEVVPSPANENDVTFAAASSIESFVCKKAAIKAEGAVPLCPDALVMGCDTIVVCKGKIYEKPKSPAECIRFLEDFSESTCTVITAVALRGPDVCHNLTASTELDFRRIPKEDSVAYAATSEPYDKSGGFACLGHAARWISCMRGDAPTVLGLPICAFADALERLGLTV
ncbi:Maf-like protein yhdE [Giardia lamblia P15]|uniref:Maf-like protein yhdE n=1 Tax=Giardia intestinalis (strain P15) TaxID=658858 RepID=E1F3P6_GIAIA|nr:Maf-like protein yhdE [Giardia lamblia P15]